MPCSSSATWSSAVCPRPPFQHWLSGDASFGHSRVALGHPQMAWHSLQGCARPRFMTPFLSAPSCQPSALRVGSVVVQTSQLLPCNSDDALPGATSPLENIAPERLIPASMVEWLFGRTCHLKPLCFRPFLPHAPTRGESDFGARH